MSGADDPRFQRLARLAALRAQTSKAAIIEFVDGQPRLKASAGGDWPLAEAFAGTRQTLATAFFTGDLSNDPDARVLCEQADGMRFFAAVPIGPSETASPLGLLCLADPAARDLPDAATREALSDLAAVIADLMIADRQLLALRDEHVFEKQRDEQRETLVAELDHRIKNVLAAVQSLALQSARKAPSLEGFLKTFSGRLKAMTSAQQLLTATRWRGAGLRDIAAAELGGLAPGQTRWEGPDVFLTPRAANALSLALHELSINAIKFGALSIEAGRVMVRWSFRPDGGLELSWVEDDGPPVAPPTRHGFGSTLLERVTGRELEGSVKVDYRREGVRATLIAAASAMAEPEPAAAPPPPARVVDEAPTSNRPVDQAAKIQGLRLLIVEDALLLALELEAGLEEAGAQIMGAAADVDEAMRMVDLPLDAAVLDANLNGVSVAPVAEALAARGIPFVFATGYGDSKMAPQGYGAPIIRKPYDVTQVAIALAEITGRL